MLSQLEAPFSLAASRALLEEVPHLSAIASYLAWSLEFFDFLIISFPELMRLLDAVYNSSLVHILIDYGYKIKS